MESSSSSIADDAILAPEMVQKGAMVIHGLLAMTDMNERGCCFDDAVGMKCVDVVQRER